MQSKEGTVPTKANRTAITQRQAALQRAYRIPVVANQTPEQQAAAAELAAAHARAQRLRFAASPSFAAMLEQAFATRRASA
jgi:hypothetical protein